MSNSVKAPEYKPFDFEAVEQASRNITDPAPAPSQDELVAERAELHERLAAAEAVIAAREAAKAETEAKLQAENAELIAAREALIELDREKERIAEQAEAQRIHDLRQGWLSHPGTQQMWDGLIRTHDEWEETQDSFYKQVKQTWQTFFHGSGAPCPPVELWRASGNVYTFTQGVLNIQIVVHQDGDTVYVFVGNKRELVHQKVDSDICHPHSYASYGRHLKDNADALAFLKETFSIKEADK